jgi:hypothetical protein
MAYLVYSLLAVWLTWCMVYNCVYWTQCTVNSEYAVPGLRFTWSMLHMVDYLVGVSELNSDISRSLSEFY